MNEPKTVQIEFGAVDPKLLELLWGGAVDDRPAPVVSIEVLAPVRRTFWQWLFRKPRQWVTIFVPRATLEEQP